MKKIKLVKKPITQWRVRVRSRHPSHNALRNAVIRLPFKSVIRLGSETVVKDVDVECNTVEAVKNSASKLLMKQCFTNAGVTTAPWFTYAGKNFFYEEGNKNDGTLAAHALPFPLIVKSLHGSRGRGNSKIEDLKQLEDFLQNNNCNNYIFEQYKTYNREYRLHVTEQGCFYTCRKMLKRDTPEDKKFQRHDDNCVWILEENPAFDKPVNWDAVVADCVKALKSLGLDIGAFDLKIQSAKDGDGKIRKNPEWIVIESCSAPSFGEKTAEEYIKMVPQVLTNKFNSQKGN